MKKKILLIIIILLGVLLLLLVQSPKIVNGIDLLKVNLKFVTQILSSVHLTKLFVAIL